MNVIRRATMRVQDDFMHNWHSFPTHLYIALDVPSIPIARIALVQTVASFSCSSRLYTKSTNYCSEIVRTRTTHVALSHRYNRPILFKCGYVVYSY